MLLTQLSVFIENHSGRLADLAQVLGTTGVDIRAISVADTTDFGIVRLIVDKPEEAYNVLSENHFTVKRTEVIAVGIDDKPGEFADVLRVLVGAGIEVEYMYAFISRDEGRAFVILRVADNAAAVDVLNSAGKLLLDPSSIYNM